MGKEEERGQGWKNVSGTIVWWEWCEYILWTDLYRIPLALVFSGSVALFYKFSAIYTYLTADFRITSFPLQLNTNAIFLLSNPWMSSVFSSSGMPSSMAFPGVHVYTKAPHTDGVVLILIEFSQKFSEDTLTLSTVCIYLPLNVCSTQNWELELILVLLLQQRWQGASSKPRFLHVFFSFVVRIQREKKVWMKMTVVNSNCYARTVCTRRTCRHNIKWTVHNFLTRRS